MMNDHPNDCLWQPSKEQIQNSLLYKFMVNISNQEQHLFHDYRQLHRWSITHSDRFWQHLWNFSGVIGEQGNIISYCPEHSATPNKDRKWFPEAKLNFAENLLGTNRQPDNLDALVFYNETNLQPQQRITWKQLYRHVAHVAEFLKSAGIQQGDVVAGYLPNVPQTVIAMLATTSLGAIWTSTSPDFGVTSVVERFSQTQPKVIFITDGYIYNAKPINILNKNKDIIHQLPSISHVVMFPYLECDNDIDDFIKNISRKVITKQWRDIISNQENHTPKIKFQATDFNHPLYILYSSGTTGKPKCIVHSVGGTLLNHLKEHQLHCDIKPKDKIMYFTTCGWMMWNWMVSTLASGASLVLYDGSPLYPDEKILWHIAEQEQLALFGTSAKYLETMEKRGLSPTTLFDLNSLKIICSTGSVLAPEQFDFVYQNIKADVQLASIAGGTDICGCFAIGNPIGQVRRGECQVKALAMAVDIFDPEGNSVTSESGELVCCNSFPNQPIGFVNDPEGNKYHTAYWDHYPNTWHHGDFVSQTPKDGLIFYGRSDTVLNPGGVRIGTAEIYRQVNNFDEILDSVAVGQKWKNDVRIILFVQLQPQMHLTDLLKEQIQTKLFQQCSPRHVPAEVFQVQDIPKTKSGKLAELAVSDIINNRTVKNTSSLINPESLEFFKKIT